VALNPRPSRISALSYRNIKKTLIIRACGVGDFVLNLPALIALQGRRPDTRFTLVGNPSTLELAREFVAVENVSSIEVQPWSRLFYEPVTTLAFDSAILWMKDPAVAANLESSGVADVVRFDPFPTYGHAADHLLRTLKMERPALPDLWTPSSDHIVVHAGSGSSRKNWPKFNDLFDRCKDCVPLPQNLTLSELSRELRLCRAFVGNDSGITHLAAYLGCPTVALFGPTDPCVWGPIGRRTRIIWKTRLEDITVDEILVALHGTHS
jgi:heptosyltransferase III